MLMAALAACCAASCAPSSDPSAKDPDQSAFTENADDGYASDQEREYARIGARFAALLMTGDYAAAHAMCSSHLRAQLTVEQMEVDEKSSQAEYGKPLRGVPWPAVNTDPDDLAGPKRISNADSPLDASLQRMSASRAVGELPDSVPLEIRRASVEIQIERDPRTIPNFEEQTGLKPEVITDEDQVVSFLVAVIVEEDSGLKVAHYFHRWPDLWD